MSEWFWTVMTWFGAAMIMTTFFLVKLRWFWLACACLGVVIWSV